MPHTINLNALDSFTTAYLECALWSSTDESREDGGDPLDDNYGLGDLAESALREAIEDCKAFQSDHADDIGTRFEQAGHDFWLTRNRHGAGFWDGDWPQEASKRLTDDSHVYGSVDLYVGDDGLIYC